MKYFYALMLFLTFNASAQTNADEQQFRQTLKKLKTAVRSRNLNAARLFMQFPFYTAKSDAGGSNEQPTDAITSKEFEIYKSDIFNQEVIRILPKLSEDNLSEIQGNKDTYYAALRKTSDPGSKLYEVYAEYKQKGRNTESYFGFIFARIKGDYKVIAYYGKWPVR